MTAFHTDASQPATPFRQHRARSLVTILMTALILAGSFLLAATPAGAQVAGDTAETTANLNLRTGPSLQDEILTVMPAGSTVEITGAAENGFYPVTFQDLEGFAHGDYLATSGGAATTDTATAGSGVNGSDGYSTDEIVQIIYNAAAMYGQSGDDLLRVAQCESVLDPNAVNASSGASGLFQFLPSTWATTPYAGQDIFDPVANAEAAAWMWANGRRGEWVCQ